MPNRSDIEFEVKRAADKVRWRYLKGLSAYTKRDTIVYATAFASAKLPGLPSFLISITNEDIQGFMVALEQLNGTELDLILHSPGGVLEAAEQIVKYLRAQYNHIRVIIPQNAMSAATIMACGADRIVMGKQSAIGPIDPQMVFPMGQVHFTAPAQSILEEFEEAKESVKADPRTAALWISKINNYPPGFLKVCEDTIARSKEVVTEWLTSYMFKGEPDATGKAVKIAQWLGNTKLHKSHGKPFMAEDARNEGLKVDFLEEDPSLQDHVLSVFHSVLLTFETTPCVKLVENHNSKGRYLSIQMQVIPRPVQT